MNIWCIIHTVMQIVLDNFHIISSKCNGYFYSRKLTLTINKVQEDTPIQKPCLHQYCYPAWLHLFLLRCLVRDCQMYDTNCVRVFVCSTGLWHSGISLSTEHTDGLHTQSGCCQRVSETRRWCVAVHFYECFDAWSRACGQVIVSYHVVLIFIVRYTACSDVYDFMVTFMAQPSWIYLMHKPTFLQVKQWRSPCPSAES